MTRPISTIAREIAADWRKPCYAAVPYLRAMYNLDTVNDTYGIDYARSIVRYFLANASSWRGETARRIKAELNAMLWASAELDARIERVSRMTLEYVDDDSMDITDRVAEEIEHNPSLSDETIARQVATYILQDPPVGDDQ
jgi:hypothetical protein